MSDIEKRLEQLHKSLSRPAGQLAGMLARRKLSRAAIRDVLKQVQNLSADADNLLADLAGDPQE